MCNAGGTFMQAASAIPAAQYLRVSTEHQQYSMENQAEVIQRYAETYGISIVRSYEDAGKSGLVLKNRAGLRQLIQDVVSGTASFRLILVYDVSRWDASRTQTRQPITSLSADARVYLFIIVRSAFRTITKCPTSS